ncbi:MAG: PEP-CTERM sorting domain-containing protein [Tepidisphaeraceae bacterium]
MDRTRPYPCAWGKFSVSLLVLTIGSASHGAFNAPAGYQSVDLQLQASSFGVSPNGRLVTANVTNTSATITLYDTWQTNRQVLKTATLAGSFPFLTDFAFTSESQVIFGENGPTDSLWSVDFGAATPTPQQLTATGSFPNIQGVALASGGGSMLVSGTTAPFGQMGGLYLSRHVLGGATTPIVTNAGSGFVAGPGVTPGGAGILLDSAFPAGVAHLYDGTTNAALNPVDLGPGGGSGAYAIVFDSAGIGYVTTGNTITRVADIDGASPDAGNFGTFVLPSEFPFLTGIAFTGDDFRAGFGNDTGALIANNGGFTSQDGLFAIVPVPEPSAVAIVSLAALGLLARRRRRAGAALGVALVALAGVASPTEAAQFFATSVQSTAVGGSQSGSFANPALVLGGPQGDPGGVQHVYNTGVGGSITLGFDDGPTQRAIVNGAGADFIVFENPFNVGSNVFAELVYVEVSTNGADFARFPVISNTPSAPGPFGVINPSNVAGFGGVHPVAANVVTNAISPFDPAVAGGDAFDLAALAAHPLVVAGTVDLEQIRYLRLVDVIGNGLSFDNQATPHAIFDPTGSGNNGADLDAVSVINGAVVPEPAAIAMLALATAGLLRRRSGSLSPYSGRGQGGQGRGGRADAARVRA